MADIKVEKREDNNIVVITGEMTIQNASALRDALIQSTECAEHVILDLKDVTEIDLSCLQLLCAAHRTSVNSQKSLKLKQDYPEILKKAVTEAGYSRYFGCKLETEKSCIWKGI
ncbi:MAG: STAS domain-containing protein [Nitrospirae bacterium]|nr:STAS domain-containing protein [Nitrospirota bacterium]